MQSCRKINVFIIIIHSILINSCTSISEEVEKKHVGNSTSHYRNNYLIIDHLSDNEKEIRIKWKDLMGKETTLDTVESERFANR